MKRIKFTLIAIVLLSLFKISSLFANDILTVDKNQSHFKIKTGNILSLILRVKLDPEWHINSNKPNEDYLYPTDVSLKSKDGFLISDKKFPPAKNLNFEFTEVPVSVFEGEFEILAIVKVPENLKTGIYNFDMILSYQACNNQTCLPPSEKSILVEIEVVSNSDEEQKNSDFDFSKFNGLSDSSNKKIKSSDQDSMVSSIFNENSLFLAFIFIFLGGLALNLTPCVYPLIPITLGYFGGQSENKTSRLFKLAILYVIGMAITYSVIGVVTALSGSLFGSLLQNPIVLIGIAAVLVALSLSMFGLYEFQLPNSLVVKLGEARSGYFGAFFMGLTMGVVAAPCIGPFVVGLLTFVGAKGDPLFGFFVFFVLALGLGFPYLFLGVFSGKIKSLPRSGEWMIAVKKIFGFVLIGMAIYFILPLLPETYRGNVLPSFMILTSVYLLFFDKTGSNVKTFVWIKSIILGIVLILGFYLLIPSEKESIEWTKVSAKNIEVGNGTPTIIDFYADWCIPCKELDAMTFTDSRVIEESKRLRRLKVDLTKTGSEETQFAMQKYEIVGVPTVIFFDKNGNEVKRITSFVNADEFLEIMKSVE